MYEIAVKQFGNNIYIHGHYLYIVRSVHRHLEMGQLHRQSSLMKRMLSSVTLLSISVMDLG